MDKKEFDKLAAINKFALGEEEAERIFARLERSIEALAPLAQAELGDTPIMVYAKGIVPVYREDKVSQSISREEILAGAPEQAEHCFSVPRVAD